METEKRIFVRGGEGANRRKTRTQGKATAVTAPMPYGLPTAVPGAPMLQTSRPTRQPQKVAVNRATKAKAVSPE